MKLVFGLAADSRVFPDFPGSSSAVLSEAVVGPKGLMNILETQLGLTGASKSEAVRIAAYTSKLLAALTERPAAFYKASIDRDAWATAELLLKWRDELVLSGWSRSPVGSSRIDDLAAAEAISTELPSGFADRLTALLEALKAKPKVDVAEICLVDDRASLPGHIGDLLDALVDCGVPVTQLPIRQPASTGGDLAIASQFLTQAKPDAMSGDGSFVMVHADTALLAAEAVAEWLAADTEAALNDTVIVAPDGDTALLDQALKARSLPALGQSALSPWRGALQVLPLAFAIAWRPFNPKPLLDLLLLPRPPIGRVAARNLAYALSKEPGTGGVAWTEAWDRTEATEKERQKDNPNVNAVVAKKMARWRDWMTVGQHDRKAGIPAAAAKTIATRVAHWAIQTDGGEKDPLLLSVTGAATALVDAIDVLGVDPLPALLVERMIEQVLAEGAENPDHIAQSGGLRSVRHPGALWGTASRVIWWNFTGPGERVNAPTDPWSNSEVKALEDAGCKLATPAETARRISQAYENVVFRAKECLMLVRPALSGSDETTSHPLAHQLAPVLKLSGSKVTWHAERLLESTSVSLAKRNLVRQLAAPASLPKPNKAWKLPPSAIAKVKDHLASPTGLERLVDCQMRWLLGNVLRLSAGRFAEIPNTNQLLGNLAHEIASKVFVPGVVLDEAKMTAEVGRIFDELVDSIAAPLNQPENAGELIHARAHVPGSLAHLGDFLRKRNLEVVGTELDRSADLGDLKIVGRLDMLVKDGAGKLGVIDLKWSHSASSRQKEITDGRAIQLAAYGAIADTSTSGIRDGAYYMLNQRRFIGQKGSLVSDEDIEVDKDLSQTWLDLVATWKVWRDTALSGTAIAGGIDGDPQPPPGIAIPPDDDPCKYCDYTSLCRIGSKDI